MAYYAHSNKAEEIARPELYRLNGITHDEKLENLAILLDEDETAITKSVVDLPRNEDVITKVYNTTKTNQFTEIKKFEINEKYVL